MINDIVIARYIPENFYTDFNLDANNLEAITTAAPAATTQISTQTAGTKLPGATASPISLSLANGTTILQVRGDCLATCFGWFSADDKFAPNE